MRMNSFPLARLNDESLYDEFVVFQEQLALDVRVVLMARIGWPVAVMIRAGADTEQYE